MSRLPAIQKLIGTVDTIAKIADGIPNYSAHELNAVEDKLRNEFQVIEAHLFYVGQEVYAAANARRLELRREHILNVDKIIAGSQEKAEVKEEALKPKKTAKKGKK